jgi:hypothetical protein
MNRPTRIACLLLVAAAAAVPFPSSGQALPPGGLGLTADQYDGLFERVPVFCEYLANIQRQGKQMPMGDLSIPGAGQPYVYTGGEVIALIPKCESLIPLMLRLSPPRPPGTPK